MVIRVNCDSEVAWEAYLVRNPTMRHWEEYRPRGTWELRDVGECPPSNRQLVIFSGLPGSGAWDVKRSLEELCGRSCKFQEGAAFRTPFMVYDPVPKIIAITTMEKMEVAADADLNLRTLRYLGRLPGVKYCYSFATSDACGAFAPHPRTLARDSVRAGYLNELARLFSDYSVCVVYLQSDWRESWGRLCARVRDDGRRFNEFTVDEYKALGEWLDKKWKYGGTHPHPVIRMSLDEDSDENISEIVSAAMKIFS